MVNADEALVQYQKHLDRFLFQKTSNQEKEAGSVQCLAYLILENSAESLDATFKWFDSTLRQKLEQYANWLVERATDDRQSWENIASGLLSYSIAFQQLHEHVRKVEKNTTDGSGEPLEFYLKHLLVRTLLKKKEVFMADYKTACESFLYGMADCGPHINLMYRSVRDFAVAVELVGAREVKFDRTILDYFTRIGFECLEDYLASNLKNDFCEKYKVWYNCVGLFNLTGYSDSDACGISLMFEDCPHSLIESLSGILVKSDDLEALVCLEPQSRWAAGIQEAYARCREVKLIEDSFDQLLPPILLLNSAHPYTEKFETIHKIRLDFIESVTDVTRFHTKLINYLDLSFKKNYDNIRRAPQNISDQSLDLWASAAFFLIKFHVPEPEIFLERYVEESLVPEILMLNTKFPSYYNDGHCLQRFWINKLRESGPLEAEYYFSIVDEFLITLENDQTFERNLGFPMIKVYLSNSRHQNWFNSVADAERPIWPSSQMKERWDDEVQRFAKAQKDLRGLYKMHTITMSSPFSLPNGRRLTLLTSLWLASVVYQFNDFDLLKASDICKLLNTDNEAKIIGCLEKLKKSGIIEQDDRDTYKINEHYKPSAGVAKSGVIRCI